MADKPKYPPKEGTEKELLESHLQFARDTLIYKASGLSDELGRKRLGKTMTSVLGIVKHMVNVEKSWFQAGFKGEKCEFDWSDEKPDGDFEIGAGETAQTLLDRYRKACRRAREICAEHDVDDLSVKKGGDGKPVPLRWIYLHMIDETARHNGHLDIYRELLDGQVDC